MAQVETTNGRPNDDLEYYVTESELGWTLVLRRGAKLSLTQHFASMPAAIMRGSDIRSAIEPSHPLTH